MPPNKPKPKDKNKPVKDLLKTQQGITARSQNQTTSDQLVKDITKIIQSSKVPGKAAPVPAQPNVLNPNIPQLGPGYGLAGAGLTPNPSSGVSKIPDWGAGAGILSMQKPAGIGGTPVRDPSYKPPPAVKPSWLPNVSDTINRAGGIASTGGVINTTQDIINSILGSTGRNSARPLPGGGALGGLGNTIGGLMDIVNETIRNHPPDLPEPSVYTPETYTPPKIDFPEAKEFEFKRNDFTDEAEAATAKAYGPQFAAIDASRDRANSDYNRNDTVVEGLQKELMSQLAANAAKTDARYAKAETDAGTRAGALQDTIGDAYTSSAKGANAELAALGQKAGPTSTEGLARDSGNAQANAATTGALQQNAYSGLGTSAGTFNDRISDANAIQGKVDRENLMYALQDQLYNYDQDEFAAKGNMGQQSLEMGMQLGDRDFALQQANYGAYNDAINRTVQEVLAQAGMDNQAGMANVDARNQAGIFNINQENQHNQDEYTRWNDTNNRRIELQKMGMEAEAAARQAEAEARQQQIENQQKDAGIALDWDKWNNGEDNPRSPYYIPSDRGGNEGGDGLTYPQLPSPTQLEAQATQILSASQGEKAPEVAKGLINWIGSIAQMNPVVTQNKQQFIDWIKAKGTSTNLDPTAIVAIADSWWDRNVKSSLPPQN